MIAELLDDARTARPAIGGLLGEQAHGAVDADLEHLFRRRKARIFAVMLNVRPVAAEACHNWLARLRMGADLAGKRQQRERTVKLEALGVGAFRDRGALRLFLAVAFAKLDVRTEAAGAERDVEAGLGIGAEDFRLGGRGLVPGLGELPSIAAFRIVGATDEGAKLADLQAEAPHAARGTTAWIAARGGLGEDVGSEQIVQSIEHMGDPELADIVHRGDELAPEIAQHILPFELARRDEIELLLEIGGEVVLDIATEEALEKGRDQPPLVFGIEPLLVEADIF